MDDARLKRLAVILDRIADRHVDLSITFVGNWRHGSYPPCRMVAKMHAIPGDVDSQRVEVTHTIQRRDVAAERGEALVFGLEEIARELRLDLS